MFKLADEIEASRIQLGEAEFNKLCQSRERKPCTSSPLV